MRENILDLNNMIKKITRVIRLKIAKDIYNTLLRNQVFPLHEHGNIQNKSEKNSQKC